MDPAARGASQAVDWAAVRAEFPALANWTYLNSATFGQMPRRGAEAVARHFARRDALACADFLDWFDDMDRIRAKAARLINAAADDVCFVPTAAHGLALVANALDWKPGDRLVTLAGEFPNYLYMPALVGRFGVEYREEPWERFLAAIDGRTRLVAVSEVNYCTGFRPPLDAIAERCRASGALLFVDGTQSTGALRFDAARAGADILAVHAYKWMLAPNGAGFQYMSPAARAKLPPTVVGWRSHEAWREVDHLHHGTPVFSAAAERYEGGFLMIANLYALEASLDLMLEIGVEAIERRVLELAGRTRAALRALGAAVPETGSQIVCAKFGGADPSALARRLKERRVLVAARKGALRVSPHLYNNEDDIAILAAELGRLL
jgi:selenocysteine lyase/cysteine desulfurase